MAESGKGPVQNYEKILKALDPRKPYSVADIMDFAADKGLLTGNPTSGPEFKRGRACVGRTLGNYTKRLAEDEKISNDEHGGTGSAWFGYHWQARLLKLSQQKAMELEEIGKEIFLARLKERSAKEAALNRRQRKIRRLKAKIAARADKTSRAQVAAEGESPPGRKHWFSSGRGLLLAGLASVGLVLSAAGVLMIKDPFQVLQRDGLAAAKETLPEVPQTADEIYQESWLAYLEGKQEDAVHDVYTILAKEGVPSYLRGDSFYLLGLIDTQMGKYQRGVGHYLQAYDTYLLDEANARLYIVGVEIANSFVALGLYERAETWLATSMDHYRQDQTGNHKIEEIGQYYLVKLDIAVARQRFDEALSFAKARLAEAEKTQNRSTLPYAYLQLGFWYGVNDCLELTTYYTDLASGAVLGTGDDRPAAFNMVNNLLVQRILGFPIKPRSEEAIRNWARDRDDSRLEHILDLALTIPIQNNGLDCDDETIPR